MRHFKEIPGLQQAPKDVSPSPQGSSDSWEEWEKLTRGGAPLLPQGPRGAAQPSNSRLRRFSGGLSPFSQPPHWILGPASSWPAPTLSPRSGGWNWHMKQKANKPRPSPRFFA